MSAVAEGIEVMSEVARLNLHDQEIELPIVVGTEDERAIDISQAAGRDRLHHARRRLRQHRLDDQRHHLSRRRGGHPALPRLPDRGAGPATATFSRSATC